MKMRSTIDIPATYVDPVWQIYSFVDIHESDYDKSGTTERASTRIEDITRHLAKLGYGNYMIVYGAVNLSQLRLSTRRMREDDTILRACE